MKEHVFLQVLKPVYWKGNNLLLTATHATAEGLVASVQVEWFMKTFTS